MNRRPPVHTSDFGTKSGLPHAVAAATVENLTVEWVPALGGKISSLRWRGREWLLRPQPTFDWAAPRRDYEIAGLCGWDEMFPTIVGPRAPDHGEVWNHPWHQSSDRAEEIGMTCTSVPARFARAVTVLTSDHVRLDYRVQSLATQPFAFLWAAHPLFAVSDADVVSIDGAPLHAVAGSPTLHEVRGGARIDELVEQDAAAKWWNDVDDRVSALRLTRGDHEVSITVDAPVPVHFGLWADRSALAHADNVSLQPALGWHDDLERAMSTGTAPVLAVDETLEWSVHVRFHSVDSGISAEPAEQQIAVTRETKLWV